MIDQSHRGLQPKSQEGKPCVIVAKLHYYQDCMDILRRAREFGPLRFKDTDIYIFPDYPPSVVHARSAFSEVRRLLCGRDGVKYGLLYPARLRITFNGTEKRFQNPEEAMIYVKTKIMPDTPKVGPWFDMCDNNLIQHLIKVSAVHSLTQHLTDTLCTATEPSGSRLFQMKKLSTLKDSNLYCFSLFYSAHNSYSVFLFSFP